MPKVSTFSHLGPDIYTNSANADEHVHNLVTVHLISLSICNGFKIAELDPVSNASTIT